MQCLGKLIFRIKTGYAQNALPKVLAGFRKSRGHEGIALTQVRAFPEPTVLNPEPHRKCRTTPEMFCPECWRDSKPIEGTAGSFPHKLTVPGRIHNHAHNALPQVLTRFRIPPWLAVSGFAPNIWGDSR